MSSSLRNALVGGLLGGAAAGVLNLVLQLGAAAAGAPIRGELGGPGTPVVDLAAWQTVIASILPAFAAWGVFAVLQRVTRTPAPIFIGIAVVFGLLSMGGPATVEASTSSRALLAAMHVTAGILIPMGLLRGMARPA